MTTGELTTVVSLILGVIAIIGTIIKGFKWAVEKIREDYKAELADEWDHASICELMTKLEANSAGTMALLRYRLRAEMKLAIARGHTTETEYADIKGMFEAYNNLGGNGTIAHLYEDYEELPMK